MQNDKRDGVVFDHVAFMDGYTQLLNSYATLRSAQTDFRREDMKDILLAVARRSLDLYTQLHK